LVDAAGAQLTAGGTARFGRQGGDRGGKVGKVPTLILFQNSAIDAGAIDGQTLRAWLKQYTQTQAAA
jgi:hypothetical protein